MKIGPKYKIARRLQAPIFEKTQTQKYALSEARKSDRRLDRKHPSQRTDYGRQMMEKQKARFSYLLTERQFAKYVKQALHSKKTDKIQDLFESLELRLDNVTLRIGLAPTRSAARQLVSHGHITVNDRRQTIPSFMTRPGDQLAVRLGSRNKKIFQSLAERLKEIRTPDWIKFDLEKQTAEIVGRPNWRNTEALFDLKSVLEFYSR